MSKTLKRFAAALVACGLISVAPGLAEARVQKPGTSLRAPHVRTLVTPRARSAFRPMVRQSTTTSTWWNRLDVQQQVDYMLYGGYLE